MRCTAEPNRLIKNSYMANTWAVNGTLRDGCSITNPVITIQKPTSPVEIGYNYMYIKTFKRYYFIDDITSVRDGLWEIKAHVDVLQSFATDILNSKCIISKTEDDSDANLYLNDGSFVMDARKFNQVKEFSTGFSSSGSNILICAGG